MIRPLRQRHRYAFIVLSAVLPATVVIGLSSRKPVPPTANLPAALVPETGTRREIWKRSDLFAGRKIGMRLLRSVAGDALAIELAGDLSAPDVLVYWSSTANPPALPSDAVLLGPVAQKVPVPRNVVARNGHLLLYSLANHEIVAASQPLQLSH